jgi:hypothetical protein
MAAKQECVSPLNESFQVNESVSSKAILVDSELHMDRGKRMQTDERWQALIPSRARIRETCVQAAN